MKLDIWREAIRDRKAAVKAKSAAWSAAAKEVSGISDSTRALYEAADRLDDKARESYRALFTELVAPGDKSIEALKYRARIERAYWNIVGIGIKI